MPCSLSLRTRRDTRVLGVLHCRRPELVRAIALPCSDSFLSAALGGVVVVPPSVGTSAGVTADEATAPDAAPLALAAVALTVADLVGVREAVAVFVLADAVALGAAAAAGPPCRPAAALIDARAGGTGDLGSVASGGDVIGTAAGTVHVDASRCPRC